MSHRTRWLLVWVASILPLLGWWTTGLLDLDEGFYAAVTSEMNRRGEWIIPYYNGSPWYEKPILLYWLAKPSLAIFGQDFGARLPAVLSTVALYGLLAWFARRRFSDQVAQLTLLILAGSLLFVALGRMMMTDMPLVLALTASLLFAYESRSDARWCIASGAALGIGVLAKGPVAVIFFVAIWGWMALRNRRDAPGRAPNPGMAILAALAFVAVVALWYLPALLIDGPRFVQKFLIEQNVGRFAGGDAAHTLGPESVVFYLPMLLVGMAPWSFFIPQALLKRRQPSPLAANIDPYLASLLASWAVIVFVFFSIGGAKLPHYILPMFPPLAMLIALRLKEKAIAYAGAWALAMAFIANAGFYSWYQQSGQAEAHRLARYMAAQAGPEGEIALYQLGRRQSDRGTGKLKLQETSLPSVIFVLDRAVVDTDKLEEIIDLDKDVLIFTRDGRMLPEDFAKAQQHGMTLEELHPSGLSLQNFALFRLRQPD